MLSRAYLRMSILVSFLFTIYYTDCVYNFEVVSGVRSCYDEGKRTAETLTMDYHRGADVEVTGSDIYLFKTPVEYL